MWITHAMTFRMSSVSAVQFTAEKSKFKCLATTDRKCFCSTTSNLAQNFTPDILILILDNSADELNVIKVK